MREIVTLQLGHLSNYVATHFWNAQESYFTYADDQKSPVDHGIHWRAGLGADGSETFLPRTVVYDLKGGFGSLRKINPMYDATGDAVADASLWSGPSKVQKQEQLPPSSYLQSLDAGTKPDPLQTSSVRYWSDFSRAYYHPKSLVQLYDFELHSPTMPFDRFSMGTELFSALNRDEDIVDRDWRPFVEECDNMQGIQVFTSLDDGWGGFASSYMEALRDEFPKSCIWVWGLQTPLLDTPRQRRQIRTANVAQTLHQCCTQATMVVPLSVPEARLPSNITLDRKSTWHVSALLATAAESGTLQSRLALGSGNQATSLEYLAESLNTTGNQTLARAQMTVGPYAKDNEDDDLDLDLFRIAEDERGKRAKPGSRSFGQIRSSRGPPLPESDEDEDEASRRSRKRNIIGNSVVRRYNTALKFPLLDSYPQIYTDAADQEATDVRTVLSTDKSIATRVKSLKAQIGWSVGVDERENLTNGLLDIADAYQDDWSSGSDDDDDDM